MASGGNAFDAAVAASFALGVLLPHLSGLGGDFFALFYDAKAGRVRCLNASGWAPSGMTVEAVLSRHPGGMPSLGAYSVVVPGLVGGVGELHARHGTVEFGRLLAPAVRLAEEGFPASPSLSRALRATIGALPREAQLAFGDGDGLPPGGRLRQARLGQTLRDVAERGAEGFYGGRASKELVEVLEAGGMHSLPRDFNFEPEWVDPLEMEYRGTKVFEVPPNSMGAAALFILRRLEGAAPPPPDSAERVAMVTEATKAALRAKDRLIGDPRFVGFDLETFLEKGESADRPKASAGDTTYFAVADAEGNLLSCIQSLFNPFGSRLYLPQSGFFLNDRASAFALQGPNQVAPCKRPVHTLSAMLLSREGGAPYMAMGTSAGERRPQLHALFVSNVVDYSMDLEAALGYPRFVWDGEETVVEEGYKVRDADGVRVVPYPHRQGVAQGIEIALEGKKAVCDVRGDGEPDGS